MSASPRLLITGFGPFPGFPDNPAGLVIGRLSDRAWRPAMAETAFAILPTTWTGAVEALAAAIAAERPEGVLLVGVAGGAEGFRVETLARNRIATIRPDAVGALRPAGPIAEDGPAEIAVTAPARAMLAALADAGLPARLSDDAGDYLCNYALYRLLADLAQGRPAGFLHIPPLADASGHGLPFEALETGVRLAAAAFAGALRHAQPNVA